MPAAPWQAMMDRRKFLMSLGACGAGLALADRALGEPPPPLGRIAYQLSWLKNFQFAGEYIAAERRYYQQFGLEVDLLAAGPIINVDPLVASGVALVGQSSPDFTTNAVARGAALRCIGANYKKNVFCMISMARTPLRSPNEMIGEENRHCAQQCAALAGVP